MVIVFRRDQAIITRSSQKNDLLFSKDPVYLNRSNFEIALSFLNLDYTPLNFNVLEYLSISVQNLEAAKGGLFKRKELQIEKC